MPTRKAIRKEKPTKEKRAFTGVVDPSSSCCGQGELGAITVASFPKGHTRKVLNWLQSECEFKQYQCVTYINIAKQLAANLKAGGAIGVRLIPWTNPMHGSRLGTVIFHVENPRSVSWEE
jgi:hypothetical protein